MQLKNANFNFKIRKIEFMSDIQTQNEKPKAPTFENFLMEKQDKIIQALPKHLDAEKFIRTVLNAAIKNPKLLQCSRESLFLSVMQAAQLGLEPDGLLGQAYILPYKDVAQLQIGYRGYITLALQSGYLSFLTAEAVHENDECHFDYFGKSTFKPCLTNRGDTLGYVSICKYKNGDTQFTYMNLDDIHHVRSKSHAYNNAIKYRRNDSPWITDFDEMAKKTVLKRLQKYLPLSVNRAITIDDFNENHFNNNVASQKFEYDQDGVILSPDNDMDYANI